MKKEAWYDKELLEDLQAAIRKKDNITVHEIYDVIFFEIARKHEPETVEKLEKLVKNIDFWYA